MSDQYLALVNAAHPCQSSPALRDLVPVGPDIYLARPAAEALQALLAAIGANGRIVPVSGWRSGAEQADIYNTSLRENGAAFTQKYVALPGHSEHQTGLAIDLGLNRGTLDFIRPAFPQWGICGAFRRHAAEYGFVLRYPKGKEGVTGIAHEPWHFRYVGVPHAAAMASNRLCLEEYLDGRAAL